MKRLLLVIVVLIGIGCSRVPSEDALPRGESPAPGGGGQAVPNMEQRSIASGSTGVDVLPSISFGLNCSPSGVADLTPAIAEHTHFVDARGRTTDVKVTPDDPKANDSAGLRISPVQPLAPDTWNWLLITPFSQVVVRDTNHKGDASATFATRFFTGSAPHVLRVEYAREKNGLVAQMIVSTSEAVQIGSLVDDAFTGTSGGKPLFGCVELGATTCVDAKDSRMSDGFVFRLASPIDPSMLSAVELVLGPRVMGSGRTVAEGAVASGELASSGARHASVVFEPCDDGGGCWSEPQPAAPQTR